MTHIQCKVAVGEQKKHQLHQRTDTGNLMYYWCEVKQKEI